MGLQYDNSAFSYFLLASLSLYLIPSYLYVARTAMSYFSEGGVDLNKARSEKERDKLKKIKALKKSEVRRKRREGLSITIMRVDVPSTYSTLQDVTDTSIATPQHCCFNIAHKRSRPCSPAAS